MRSVQPRCFLVAKSSFDTRFLKEQTLGLGRSSLNSPWLAQRLPRSSSSQNCKCCAVEGTGCVRRRHHKKVNRGPRFSSCLFCQRDCVLDVDHRDRWQTSNEVFLAQLQKKVRRKASRQIWQKFPNIGPNRSQSANVVSLPRPCKREGLTTSGSVEWLWTNKHKSDASGVLVTGAVSGHCIGRCVVGFAHLQANAPALALALASHGQRGTAVARAPP